jgi:beta-glucosidase
MIIDYNPLLYMYCRLLLGRWITTGVGWMCGRYVGNIPPIDDFPRLCLEDTPLGVRFAIFVIVFPATINAAST